MMKITKKEINLTTAYQFEPCAAAFLIIPIFVISVFKLGKEGKDE